MNIFKKTVTLATHNSSFHADEVFATACLKIYFEDLKNNKTKIVRSRDTEITDKADILFDFGMEYNPDKNRYDHHQKGGAGKRGKYDIPYSAFGLIWKHYGEELVENKEIHEKIDTSFIQQVCATDTGAIDFKIENTDWVAWTFDDTVKLFYPDAIDNDNDSDEAFMLCVRVAKEILKKVIRKQTKKYHDTSYIEDKYKESGDKRIVVLDRFAIWSDFVEIHPEVLYIIFPSSDHKSYRVRATPVAKGDMNSKKPLPEVWRGKWKDELREISKLPKIEFVHNTGFLGAASDLETAIEMAQKSADWE
jgi:uncharacterized UPF0160 family protein